MSKERIRRDRAIVLKTEISKVVIMYNPVVDIGIPNNLIKIELKNRSIWPITKETNAIERNNERFSKYVVENISINENAKKMVPQRLLGLSPVAREKYLLRNNKANIIDKKGTIDIPRKSRKVTF